MAKLDAGKAASHRVGEVEGPASSTSKVSRDARLCNEQATSKQQSRRKRRCAHGVVLRVVAKTLRNNRVAEEEGEVGEDVLAGGSDGARSGNRGGASAVGSHVATSCEEWSRGED